MASPWLDVCSSDLSSCLNNYRVWGASGELGAGRPFSFTVSGPWGDIILLAGLKRHLRQKSWDLGHGLSPSLPTAGGALRS